MFFQNLFSDILSRVGAKNPNALNATGNAGGAPGMNIAPDILSKFASQNQDQGQSFWQKNGDGFKAGLGGLGMSLLSQNNPQAQNMMPLYMMAMRNRRPGGGMFGR